MFLACWKSITEVGIGVWEWVGWGKVNLDMGKMVVRNLVGPRRLLSGPWLLLCGGWVEGTVAEFEQKVIWFDWSCDNITLATERKLDSKGEGRAENPGRGSCRNPGERDGILDQCESGRGGESGWIWIYIESKANSICWHPGCWVRKKVKDNSKVLVWATGRAEWSFTELWVTSGNCHGMMT